MPEKKLAYHLGFSDVIRVLRVVDETPFRELELELGDLKVRVVREREGSPAARQDGAVTSQAAPPVSAETAPAPVAPVPPPASSDAQLEGIPVTAPLAGTFYRSPYPGQPPFVEEGAAIRQGDVVGILEIMKLMNHVKAPCSGTLRGFCVRNEEFVEFGQVLAVIEPEAVA